MSTVPVTSAAAAAASVAASTAAAAATSAPASAAGIIPVVLPEAVNKRSCLIIYTGGTIGMQKNNDGTLTPSTGYLSTTLSSIPELQHADVPSYKILEWPHPLDSSDFTSAHIATLASQIETNYYNYDGFVVLHGTDTLAYTASALSFMLSHLAKTVILTGSMIPLAAPVSDAKRNLIISLLCAVNLDIPEVCVFFNSSLLRGNRTRKLSPNSINAFVSPNFPPLAEMGVHINVNRELVLPAPRRRFTVYTAMYSNVAVITTTPLSDATCMRSFLLTSTPTHPAALVLQLYGTGGAPIQGDHPFIRAIREGASAGAVIVVLTQCYRGSIDLSQYESGQLLRQYGVIDGSDMTVECAVTKLSVLMGRGLRGDVLRYEMETASRGELTVKSGQTYGMSDIEGAGSVSPAGRNRTPLKSSDFGSFTSKL